MTEPVPAQTPVVNAGSVSWNPFRRGRRLLATAGVLLLLVGGLHAWGSFAPPPPGSPAETITEEMAAVRFPMGMGMTPSTLDIFRSLALTMSVFLVWAGFSTLTVAAVGTPADVRRRGWSGVALSASLALVAWRYHVPPPLISFAVVALVFAVAALAARERA